MTELPHSTLQKPYSGRSGQSLLEILVALGVGSILIVAAATIIVPSLRTNAQADKVQVSSSLGKELLENIRVFSEGDWHNISGAATSSANKYFLVSAVSPFVIATGTEGIAEDGVTSGLVGYWKMDESTGTIAHDFSGRGYNGTLAGSPSSTVGMIGQALQFNDTTAYAVSGGVFSDLGTSNRPYTFSVWVRVATGTTAGTIIHVSSLSNGTGWCVPMVSLSGSKFVANSWIGGLSTITGQTTAVPGTWYNVVHVWDSGGLKLYVNGTLENSNSQATYSASAAANYVWAGFRYATCAGDSGGNFNGYIDDLRVYNRALSATEVKSIYDADIYTRYVYFEDTNRDAGGSIVSGAGTNDPSTKKVNVVFGWNDGPTSTFSTYLTRFQSRIFDQTDWSGGPGQDGPATTTANTFSTSTLMNYSTTTGSISVQL